MHKHLIKFALWVIFNWAIAVEGVTRVLIELKVDMSIYEPISSDSLPFLNPRILTFFPGPLVDWNKNNDGKMVLTGFLKKNSTEIDLYSFSGKCGSVTVPIIRNTLNDGVYALLLSQTFIDDDMEWETLVQYNHSFSETSYGTYFKVFDTDGGELLADSGLGGYGFDGNNTYVISDIFCPNLLTSKSWRFRTNVLSNEPQLRKSTATARSPMQLFGVPDGGYRVNLQPSFGGQTELQLFDLAGRCVFSKVLESVKSPMSFTIPEQNIPNSPFIAKVRNNQGSFVEKKIPVR